MASTATALRFIAITVWLSSLLVIGGIAQTPQGALIGTVSDANGGRIAGATVSVAAVGSSLKRSATTNSFGEFRVEGLPPDDYRVTVTAANFAPLTYADFSWTARPL